MFTRDVAHTFAFGGSRVLEGANATLREVVETMPESKVAVHAAAVLGAPKASSGKVLVMDGEQETVAVEEAQPAEARELLSAALGDFDRAADALGHIEVTRQAERLAGVMAADGDDSGARSLRESSADTLERRGVLPGVVEALRGR